MITRKSNLINKKSTRQPEVCAVPCFKEAVVREVKASLPEDMDLRQTASLFSVLADPSRLKILLALSHHELCVCDVSHVIGLSISATSHQLRILRNLNLVHYRNDGKMTYYTLQQETVLLPLIKDVLGK